MQILLSSVSFGYMIQTCPARPPHPPSLAGRGSQSIFTQIVQIYATCSIKTLQFVIIHFCCLYGCENHADSPSLPAGWWCCPGVGVAIPPTHPPSPPTTLIFSTNQISSLLPISHQFSYHPLASWYSHFLSLLYGSRKMHSIFGRVHLLSVHRQSPSSSCRGLGWHSGGDCNL